MSFNHVRMAYKIFKVDDHKLKIEDIERIDRQTGVQHNALLQGMSRGA